MSYEHDTGRDLRRLIPYGISGPLIAFVITGELKAKGEIAAGWSDAGADFVALWFLVMLIQAAAVPWLTLLLTAMNDLNFPLLFRLPTLTLLTAIAGAAVFWWASPWKGAVCGTLALASWLLSIRDELDWR